MTDSRSTYVEEIDEASNLLKRFCLMSKLALFVRVSSRLFFFKVTVATSMLST